MIGKIKRIKTKEDTDSPEYMIINKDKGFALYRKLEPGEWIWYIKEFHRIEVYCGLYWLRLKYHEDRKQLDDFLNIVQHS
ncbi:MAG: hypothetical protein ACK5MV_04020 [Aminipila sp.]